MSVLLTAILVVLTVVDKLFPEGEEPSVHVLLFGMTRIDCGQPGSMT